jgi:hypothetical protein
MSESKKGMGLVVVKSHVLSRDGATLKVERLELSKAGTRLITSTSKSIPDGQFPKKRSDKAHTAPAAAESEKSPQ